MVTLITEKLQNQSLDDLTHKSYDAGPLAARQTEGSAVWAPRAEGFPKSRTVLAPTLKNSKSLCSLDYEDEDEDDARVKTAVSSPRDPHGLQPRPAGLSPRASPEWVAAEGEGWSGGDPSDWDSAGEEGAFPLDRSRELDLEQIENN
ncbi:hypothetical protein CB1_000208002 [Camelus ferus]|nr:hypothetical protein CB1_000208002 [Camelus ferus]